MPPDGQNFQARVVGYDVTGDVALIQLQHPSGLHQVPLGYSSKVEVGSVMSTILLPGPDWPERDPGN